MVSPMMNSFKVKLSERLATFASFYRGQDIIWDVGCDHGHLGLSFFKGESSPTIHLVDPAAPVIRKLREKVSDSYIPLISIFHQEGQEIKLDPHRSHFIFIAGMGGLEIIDILRQVLPQLKSADELLISPHNKVLDVRSFLAESGPILLREGVLKEGGIWYPYFHLGLSGRVISQYGDQIFEGESGRAYREHLLEKLSRHRDEESLRYLNFLKAR